MATSGRGGKSLVADRRYIAQKVAGTTGGRGTPPPKKPAARKAAPRRQGNILTRFVTGIWRIIWGTFWRVGAVCIMVLAGIVFYFYQQLPPVADLLDGRAKGSVTLLDRNDTVFAWRGETFGGQITADTVSPYLLHAVVATEDKRFYQHFGVSPRGIASAISINLAAGRGPLEGNGGSTITQQVAKLLCLGVPYNASQWKSETAYEADCRSGGVTRKLKEIPYSIAMEAKYTKEEILTIYFNRAYLGAGARGFEAAAQRYFGISANQVNPAQAAMLAGLLKAPSKYAPTNNLKRAQDRANVIIDLMAEQGYLTPEEAADARAHPAQLSDAAQTKSGGFFADWVMETAPDFLTSTTTEDVLMRTTLDQKLQRDAEEALAWVFDNKVAKGSKAQAAIVVMSADGAVRAMVGGRKTENAGAFNRATQASRQTGSSFKPFVYAAALDLGWSPSDYVEDVPLTLNIPGSGKWTPDNYDHKFKGLITLTQALEESRNIPAVRVSEAVGRDAVAAIAKGFGIQSDLAAGPALALGASESTLIEMTGAYAGILNGGSAVTPYGLVELKLKGEDESLMGAGGGIGERVISETAAKLLTFMMAKVVESGTGTKARLDGRPAAGKTGTTSAARDAWFIGFTADYVAGVWIGYDDNTPLKGVTGGGLPAEIWHEVMTRVEDGVPVTELPLIIPEYRNPPNAATASNQPVDPNAEFPQDPIFQEQSSEPSVPMMNPSDDQVEALLKDILKGDNQ
ncbi:MAG: glycosyl transferase [Cypionkella sp.]|uniref:transglycosylase domain-containing protein n=1 Tax=Cypionkella sp. TaxID=2811411 RepID=UPI00262116C6|nr:PBP1A family penicillin-binding protein [Cypionkella sp.]MDB5660795.1 glycosyl transferase [Cypionkella sp.]